MFSNNWREDEAPVAPVKAMYTKGDVAPIADGMSVVEKIILEMDELVKFPTRVFVEA